MWNWRLCVNAGAFVLEYQVYIQHRGLAMASHLSAVIHGNPGGGQFLTHYGQNL